MIFTVIAQTNGQLCYCGPSIRIHVAFASLRLPPPLFQRGRERYNDSHGDETN